MLDFQDFQSEEPQRNEIQPFKIIEDLKKQLEEKEKQLAEFQSTSSNENVVTTVIEENLRLKKQNEEYQEKIEELSWSENLYKQANNKLLDALDKSATINCTNQ